MRGNTTLSIHPKDFRPSTHIIKEVLKIGLPSSISQIIMSFANILMNNIAAGYGDHVISAYGVAGKIMSIAFMITVGYVSGYVPFAEYNYGSGNVKRMIQALKFTMLTSTALCLFLLFPLVGLAPSIMRAFSSAPEVVDTGIRFFYVLAISVPLLGVQLTMMTTFQATGKALHALVVNLGRQCLFYIPALYMLNHIFQLSGLMYAQAVADLLTTLTAVMIGIPLLYQLSREQRSNMTSKG